MLPEFDLGLAKEEIRRAKVNFTFKNVEGGNEVSSDASAFQIEGFALAFPHMACGGGLSLAVL